MQLRPHYGPDPLIVLDGPPSAIAAPVIRQRRRLVEVLAGLSAEQWAHPSRCEGWSALDVIIHLDSTNAFWTFSVQAGIAGRPTQFLATFDPVASPAELVAAAGDLTHAEVLDRFRASTEVFVDLLAGLDDAGWTALAEAPPGHLSVAALAHHAIWDSWIHERDILLPLGLDQVLEPDEVAASLRYAAALSPAFAVNSGFATTGLVEVAVTEPDLAFVVAVGDHVAVREPAPGDGEPILRLAGDAVALTEALSIRAPLDQEVPADAAWVLRGLAEVFDAAQPG